MSKHDYITAERHLAGLQCKHISTELCNRRTVGLKTKNIKNMPKILNYAPEIITDILNVNKQMRQMQQQATVEQKNISQKFQCIQNNKSIFRDRG